MAELSYSSYYYVGYVLSEEEFYDLKKHYQENRRLVAQSFQVNYLKEIWREFCFQISAIGVCGIIAVFFAYFMPNPSLWLQPVLYVSILVCVFGSVSLVISLLSFSSVLGSKRRHYALLLYLLEICPDHKSYLDKYYEYSYGTSKR